MRVFYDTEFDERGPAIPIQIVSFGAVSEDGRELYVINEESLTAVTRNHWLSVNVKPHLPIKDDQHTSGGFITMWDVSHPQYAHVLSREHMITEIRAFLDSIPDLELWADFGAYDHVVLCQLFGSMNDLPSGYPMFTRDIQQLLDIAPPGIQLPDTPTVPHHALYDAQWAKDAYDAIVASM